MFTPTSPRNDAASRPHDTLPKLLLLPISSIATEAGSHEYGSRREAGSKALRLDPTRGRWIVAGS